MIQHDREQAVTVTTYTCETCGASSESKDTIWRCELRHKRAACKHVNKAYEVTMGDFLEADETCKDCGKLLRTRLVYAGDLDNELAEKLFDIGEE